MIEKVESLDAEPELKPLRDSELFLKRRINLVVARTERDVAAQVAVQAGRREGEGVRIEPVVDRLMRSVNGLAGYQVRALTPGVTIGRPGLGLHLNVDREARPSGKNTRQFPSSEYL